MTQFFSVPQIVLTEKQPFLAQRIFRSFLLLSLLALASVLPADAQVFHASPKASSTQFNQPFRNAWSDGTHLAVCHFQLSCYEYGAQANGIGNGSSGTLSGYEQSINAARAMGWDGFSIDLNSPNQPYATSLARIFAACDAVNAANHGAVNAVGVGDFKLYITFDMSTFPEDPTVLATTFAQYAADPSYMTYQGRPIFSTYTGEGGGWAVVKSVFGGALSILRGRGINPFFMPGFIPTDAAGNYSYADLNGWANGLLRGFADAAWIYPNAQTPLGPGSGIPSQEAIARAVQGVGVLWQGSMIPGYGGLAHSSLPGFDGVPRFWCEYYGGEGQDAYMNSLLSAQNPFMIQGVTWNDFDEGSNYSSADVNAYWPYLAHGYVRNYYKSKLGLQAETRYELQRYKTGQAPVIADDTLVAYYRTQPAALIGTNDIFGPIVQTGTADGAPVADTVFVTAFVKQPATVQMQVGRSTVSYPVPAGVSRIRLPFVVGTPYFTLQRAGSTILQMTGESIVGTATDQNWNSFTEVSTPGVKFVLTATDTSCAVDSVGIYARNSDLTEQCFGMKNFTATAVTHGRSPAFTQNDLNGPSSGVLLDNYSPASGDRLQSYTWNSALSFRPAPAVGQSALAYIANPNTNNTYWVSGKRMPFQHVRLDLDIAHPADDQSGNAGLAFVSSTTAPYSGAGYVARIGRYGSFWYLQLFAFSNILNDQYRQLGNIPINPMAAGDTGHLSLEDNAGTFTATWTPAQ